MDPDKQINNDNCTIAATDADDMRDEIRTLMHDWAPDSMAADYRCAFCRNRPDRNDGQIVHDDDCKGKRFMKVLDDALNGAK